MKRVCPVCGKAHLEKGRAADGRRAYRCLVCRHVWTDGATRKKFHTQRVGYQFR